MKDSEILVYALNRLLDKINIPSASDQTRAGKAAYIIAELQDGPGLDPQLNDLHFDTTSEEFTFFRA